MASNLSTIGFGVSSNDDLADLVRSAVTAGRIVESPLGRYVVWPPGPEELWVQVVTSGRVVGLNPYFEGPARVRVAVVEARRDAEHPMDGWLSCWADPSGDDPESGAYPFVVDLPDFDAATIGLETPWFGEMQVAAFARTLSCWPDDASYTAAEEVRWADRSAGPGQVRGFAAESFIPSGMFGTEDAPRAEAFFTGHVITTEARANAHTGRSFVHALVKTLGGEYDVVADPEVVQGEPTPGGVVQGEFWLIGRLVPTDQSHSSL